MRVADIVDAGERRRTAGLFAGGVGIDAQLQGITAGVGGDTVVNLLRRVDDVLDEHEPDAMFVMVGGNDNVSYSQPATRGYYRKSKQLEKGYITPDEHAAAYRDLLTRISLAYVQPLVGLSPAEYSRALVASRAEFTQRARDVAEALNVPVLDLDAVFTPDEPIEREPVNIHFISQIGARSATDWDDFEAERQKWGYTYTFDGMHILPETAPQFADHIVPFLREHLRL